MVMSTFYGVLVVHLRSVVLLHRRLDTALRHHRVAVTEAQLGGEHHPHAPFCRGQRRGAAGATTADHQHVGLERLGACQVSLVDAGIGLQLPRQLGVAGIAGVGPDPQLGHGIGDVVGMELAQQNLGGDTIQRGLAKFARRVGRQRFAVGNIRVHGLLGRIARVGPHPQSALAQRFQAVDQVRRTDVEIGGDPA